MPLDNNTLAAFTTHQDAFSAAEVSSGGGGARWPDEGIHDAYINGITVDPQAEFFLGGGNSIPAVKITFEYELADDPESPENPLSWPGEPFSLPMNPADINHPGHKQRYEIGLSRLKSHLNVLLGDQFADNLAADIQSAVSKVEGEASVLAKVFCKHKPKKGDPTTIYKTDFLRELVTG